LIIGEDYDLYIFHAERQTSGSNFNFTTSIVLVDAPAVPEPGALALLALGFGGLMIAPAPQNSLNGIAARWDVPGDKRPRIA